MPAASVSTARDITALPVHAPQPARPRALVPDHLAVSATSPRSTTSRSRCRRMPAIRSGSGATRARGAELREPARAALDARRPRPTRRTPCVASMSHGEQRQLEIAMALATQPRLLLLDEPMAGHGPGRIRAHGQDAARAQARADDPAGRARHGRGVRARRPHHGAGLRPRHRLRHAGRDPRQCRGAPGLSRRAGGGDAMAEHAARSRRASRPATA